MAKKSKEIGMDLYYMNNGQARKENIEDLMKKKKQNEREKRIKQNKMQRQDNDFDLDTETVINMTNKNKIKKEQEKRKELNKKEIKRRKRIKKIKFVLKIVILIAVIAGGTAFALISPIFNIKDIQVINNSQVNSDTIVSLSGIKTGQNIFRFLKSKSIEKIKENPYIENIKIHRKLPSTIQIDVEERTPTYSIDYVGKYALINNKGYILEIVEDNRGLPIILNSITAQEEISAGQRLKDEDLEKLGDILKIMSSAKDNNLDTQVTNIDIKDKNNYSIYLEQEKKTIHLGDTSNLSNKMLYILAIIEQEKDKAGDIFVNGDLNNKFQPYFREKVYDVVIPRNIKLSEAPSEGLNIFDYDAHSEGAKAYAKLAKEVVKRNGRK